MAWITSLASGMGSFADLISKGRWANHNQHILEDGTTDFYKMAIILNHKKNDESNTVTFILDPPTLDFGKCQVTVPIYYRWEVYVSNERAERTFHIWLDNTSKKRFLVYAKMENSIRICKIKIDEAYSEIMLRLTNTI